MFVSFYTILKQRLEIFWSTTDQAIAAGQQS
jgi:hypothetical protein